MTSPSTHTDHVLISIDNHVATLTLNRPESRNSLSDEVLVAISAALDRLEHDPEVRAVVVTGAGKGFCSGGDLNDMVDRSGMFEGDAVQLRNRYVFGVQNNTRRLAAFRKPLIAAVNGHAVGAGMGMALSCDIRVISDNAKLGATFPKIGLVAGDGSAHLLQRTVGFSRAAELLLTARLFGAEEALQIGVAHHVVPADQVLSTALQIAHSIAELPPTAIEFTKSILYHDIQGPLDQALTLAAAYQVIAHNTSEHEVAVRAMLDTISSKSKA